jgi:Flp pilus assembly protein TadD
MLDRFLKSRRRVIALLTAATCLAFAPTVLNGFVGFDDADYLFGNAVVQQGLTWRGVGWAFTTFHVANWHPLAWLSHMLDWQVFGDATWGHHLVSLVLHAVVGALVFRLLDESTGERGRSAAVALLFAVHPLRVESVAWASERKDVLCLLFFVWACLAHVRRVRSNGTGTRVAVLAALALMAKPMAVTLPLVLLLLDVWPLRRAERLPALVLEKLPVLVLCGVGAVITLLAQSAGGTVASLHALGIGMRLANSALNVVRYLGLTFWPSGLIPMHPFPRGYPGTLEILGAAAFIAAVSVAAALQFRKRPAVLVGWAWFLVTLLPVVGLVQAGVQVVADRYTYLPHIGLFMALAWAVPDLSAQWRTAATAAFGASAVALGAVSFNQTRYWRNTETLFGHTLAVSPRNTTAEIAIAAELLKQGRSKEAEQMLQESIELSPRLGAAYAGLGTLLIDTGRGPEALALLARGRAMAPKDADLTGVYAVALAQAGRAEEALQQYDILVPGDPDPRGITLALGLALGQHGHHAVALELLRRAAQQDSLNAAAHFAFGVALAQAGHYPEAVGELERTIDLDPKYPAAADALRDAQADARAAR